MDPTDTNEINEQFNNPEPPQEEELSHSDKMIGVFTEPAKMFGQTALFPVRNKDWVIPIFILLLVAGLINKIAMMNEEVFFEVKEKQVQELNKQVEEGTLSREEADQRMDMMDTFMKGPISWITTIFGALIFGSIMFFILVAIYWLFIKFLLKGEGGYSSAMVASGLTGYITIIQLIITGILSFLFGTLVKDTSLASLLGSDKTTLVGWVFAKVDQISIWAYMVLSIGLAKMFKSESTGKYYALVFGLWIIGGLLIFFLSQAVPFLSFLNM
ncbi:MAG: Yip1 family protein [Ignavibacteriaceae bacterium]